MQSSEGMMDREFVELAGRIGALPEAPLAMPKQMLESPARKQGLVMARLVLGLGRAETTSGAQRGER